MTANIIVLPRWCQRATPATQRLHVRMRSAEPIVLHLTAQIDTFFLSSTKIFQDKNQNYYENASHMRHAAFTKWGWMQGQKMYGKENDYAKKKLMCMHSDGICGRMICATTKNRKCLTDITWCDRQQTHTSSECECAVCMWERNTQKKLKHICYWTNTMNKMANAFTFFCFVCASFSGSFFFWMLVYSEIDRHETKRAPPIVVHLLHRWWSNWQSCSLCASHLYQFYIFRMLCTRYHSEREKERDSDVRAHTNIDQIKVHNRMTLNFCCIFFFSIYDTKNACAMMLRKFICPMDGVCVCAIRITF